MNNIFYFTADQLEHHPKNPRRDLGDLDELTESIRVNGIMQNLTVTPVVPGEFDHFYVLMGNRRLAAGKLAHVAEYPCRIVEDLSEKEQVALMLEENMQRNDLSVIEQAQGFQMMLDLGSNIEEIIEKTGFSESTIRHRINIAKLDPELLKEKEADEEFQMSLKDLYELERIKDVETRNQILKDSWNSRTLKRNVDATIREEERKKNKAALIELAEKAGIKKAPKGASIYSANWNSVKEYDVEKKPPKKLQLNGLSPEEVYYSAESGYYFYLMSKKAQKEKSKYEAEREEIQSRSGKIKKTLKEMKDKRREACCVFLDSEITEEEDLSIAKEIIREWLWDRGELHLRKTSMQSYYFKVMPFELVGEQKDFGEDFGPGKLLMASFCESLDDISVLIPWCLGYKEKEGKLYDKAYKILATIGIELTEEERKIVDGTHELYEKDKKTE